MVTALTALYFIVGLSFSLAASLKYEEQNGKELSGGQWLFCIFLWPVILLGSWFASL